MSAATFAGGSATANSDPPRSATATTATTRIMGSTWVRGRISLVVIAVQSRFQRFDSEHQPEQHLPDQRTHESDGDERRPVGALAGNLLVNEHPRPKQDA